MKVKLKYKIKKYPTTRLMIIMMMMMIPYFHPMNIHSSAIKRPHIFVSMWVSSFSSSVYKNHFHRHVYQRVTNSLWSLYSTTNVTQDEERMNHTLFRYYQDNNQSSSRSISSSSTIQHYFPIYYNDVYEVPLPPNHRFPMNKYKLVRERIQKQVLLLQQQQQQTGQHFNHPINVKENTIQQQVDISFRISPLVSLQDLSRTHCPEYIARYLQGNQTPQEIRNVGFPWSIHGVRRSLSSTGGTVAAARSVCEAKRFLLQSRITKEQRPPPSRLDTSFSHVLWSAHVAGGTHHAFYDRGEGFCVFSDIAVAANVILRDYPDIVQRILILDLDVHQGNGNAVLFQRRKDVITFSMHCSSNYFSKKEESDLDIELPPGCDDETYLATLNYWLNFIHKDSSEKNQPFNFIFYQAGVDILQSDRLGKMNISPEGVSRRNKMVYDWVRYKMKSPMVITMGGGYPKDDDWEPILDAHSKVYIEAYEHLLQPYNPK